ncbi:MAG: hypothetical protein UR50_C0003G0025 [Parcubacteria group bacterium GW2011_GWC1_34_10]|uniref:Uncharacterized protein n=1 Tax=Candidatus Zambryskibacteria bacterium RIFCSPLOWO2_01_FULL_35_19 TaxID=1802757 RepID=A0A1G2TYF8_9BACT|nr:MAG: hypothetical protein UR50_C0003G0025 [Parcubacteria group bacterium GW2011_GWC1_34_10]OHA86722.1 MAG: hypothetical protein A2726_00085 [Candidatus Zambryskibacteria bacterium RIFCSPHIGHO2_01_FULL_35_32]OHB02336.1 MAG: hypothetical protein A3A90_00885 [Candidatus Zambryskibacteria bacterium RIFCSPLOWO2_01_FULL_35_19]
MKYQFKNSMPPRGYGIVPAILEDGANQIATSLVKAFGKIPAKLKEAQIKLDLRGKTPIMELASRYYRKHTKTAQFQIPLE